jgi:hypothetical protein
MFFEHNFLMSFVHSNLNTTRSLHLCTLTRLGLGERIYQRRTTNTILFKSKADYSTPAVGQPLAKKEENTDYTNHAM